MKTSTKDVLFLNIAVMLPGEITSARELLGCSIIIGVAFYTSVTSRQNGA